MFIYSIFSSFTFSIFPTLFREFLVMEFDMRMRFSLCPLSDSSFDLHLLIIFKVQKQSRTDLPTYKFETPKVDQLLVKISSPYRIKNFSNLFIQNEFSTKLRIFEMHFYIEENLGRNSESYALKLNKLILFLFILLTFRRSKKSFLTFSIFYTHHKYQEVIYS